MADISDYLTNLEETFYQQGLAAGTAHGELHGLFEGRALGKEKAWELWEEVGYYQGVALFWKTVLTASGGGPAR
jgi:predicted transposase YdaD